MRREFVRPILAFVVLVLVGTTATAAEWPQLGGPSRDGSVTDAGLPDGPIELETLWRLPLGSGYSGIVVASGLAVTTYSDGASDYLVALDVRNGDRRWTLPLREGHKGHDGSDDGQLSTPLIYADHVYVVTARGRLLAVELKSGEERWSTSLTERYGAPEPEYGIGTSPLAWGGRVIVQTGGDDGRGVCAFEARTGELKWCAGEAGAGYRSPVLVAVGDRTHLVTVSDTTIRGADPATGETIWEHTIAEGKYGEIDQVAAVGAGRFVMTGWTESRLFEIVRDQRGFALEQRWKTAELKGSYAVPVFHDGLLFGYSASYLVCVDAETGERVWKSRPPGAGVPIRLDDRLVLWAKGGMLHVVRADGAGYASLAASGVLEAGSLTAPAFADGVLYLRNLKEIAAVAVRKAARAGIVAEAGLPDPTDGTELGAFILGLEDEADRAAAIDRYLELHAETPLVEGDVAHFVYRGEAEDVGIIGTMTPTGSESLYRVEGTDLFYRSYRLAPASRVEYAFLVDFGEEQADTRNPSGAPGSDGKRSELRVEGWQVPVFATTPLTEPRGSIETFEIDSEAMGDTREVTVYLPDGYHDTDDDYPLLFMMDVLEAGRRSQLSAIMDRLGHGRIEPAIVVYVPFSPGFGFYDESYGGRRDDMARFVADELPVEISQLYRARDDRRQRTLFGAGWGAFAALYYGVTRSDVFAEVVALTVLTYEPVNEDLAETLAAHATKPKLEIYIGWGRFDYDLDFGEHIDMPAMNRDVAARLTRAGHRTQTRVVEAGTGWGSWWAHLELAFQRFLRNR